MHHIHDQNWAEENIRTFSHPFRQLLAERVSANAPFTDLLEVGCASGPNLYLLARRFPKVRCVGIDVNPEAIRFGKTFFEQQ